MSVEATGSKSLLPVTICHISFPSEAHQELRKVLLHTHKKIIKIKEPLFVLAIFTKESISDKITAMETIVSYELTVIQYILML